MKGIRFTAEMRGVYQIGFLEDEMESAVEDIRNKTDELIALAAAPPQMIKDEGVDIPWSTYVVNEVRCLVDIIEDRASSIGLLEQALGADDLHEL